MKSLILLAFISGIVSCHTPVNAREKTYKLKQKDIEFIEKEAIQQAYNFQECCMLFDRGDLTEEKKNQYISAVIELFESNENYIECEYLNGPKNTKPIRDYFSPTRKIQYIEINRSAENVRIIQPFEYAKEKSVDAGQKWFKGTVALTQRFEGINQATLGFGDIIEREMDVFATKKGRSWIVKLGNMRATQIEVFDTESFNHRQAREFYETANKYIQIFDDEEELDNPDEEKMYDALLQILSPARKAYQLNDEYTVDFLDEFELNLPYYIDAGEYYYNEEDYRKAYDSFNQYIEITGLLTFDEEEFEREEDFKKAQYYAAVCATTFNEPGVSIPALERALLTEYEENSVYQFLAEEYRKTENTKKQEETLKEGLRKFPDEPYFLYSLINICFTENRNDEAIEYLNTAISRDPENAELVYTLGTVYEQYDFDQAETYYLEALKMDPDYVNALFGVGRIYYNRASEVYAEASLIPENKQYHIELENGNELLRIALPYFEKVYSITSDESTILSILRNIYYFLKMDDEFDEMEYKLSLIED